MVNLLEKLGKEKSKNETRQENEIQNQKAENLASDKEEKSGIQTAAAPCSICGQSIAWWDRYGGGPHCHRCRDWPSESLVARIAAAVAGDDGTTSWLTLWPRNAADASGRPEGSQDSSRAANASCSHRRGRNRVIWPVAERGGILVADLDRVAEVKEFAECLGCGLWFLISEFQNLQKGI